MTVKITWTADQWAKAIVPALNAGAYAAAAGFALVGAIVAVVFVRGFLDLRGRDASPIPDTEPVQTIT